MKNIFKLLIGAILLQFCVASLCFAEIKPLKDSDLKNLKLSKDFNSVQTVKIKGQSYQLIPEDNRLQPQDNNADKNAKFPDKIKDLYQSNDMPEIDKLPEKQTYTPSLVEKIFNPDLENKIITKKPEQNILKQYGYEIFNGSSNLRSNNQIPKDYKLDIGDKVNISFWGDSIDILALTGSNYLKSVTGLSVDKDGNLFVPGVGIISAKDKQVSNIENQIYSALAGKFASFKVKVSVTDPGSFPVMVVGNVKQPGVIYINSASTLLDALNIAGGITKEGSLRDITHIASYNKNKTSIDLYNLLINGNYRKISLKEGDVILVKPIGKIIALSGGVKNSAIYEFKNGETLKDLINTAGGFLPSINPKYIQIESFDTTSNQKTVKDASFSDLTGLYPKDGDMLMFKSIYNQAENLITIKGNVKHPGTFQYKKGMKLSDIVKSRDELLINTYSDQALINRVSEQDKEIFVANKITGLNSNQAKEIVTIPFSLKAFFSGSIDPELQPQDLIQILPSTQMQNIEVAGSISNPGFIPFKENMTLSDILGNIDFEVSPNNLVAEITSTSKDDSIKTVYLYELLTKNDENVDIELNADDKILFRPIKENETLRTVKILGYVNNPGIYKIKPGMRINDAIEIAGGLSADSYLQGIIFIRPLVREIQQNALENYILKLGEDISMKINALQSSNKDDNIAGFVANQKELIENMREKTSQKYGRININIAGVDIKKLSGSENLEIKDGDEIFIPTTSQQVLVAGEVYNQSAIAYSPEKSAKYYIDNAGSFTKQANKREIYVIKANGISKRLKKLSYIADPGDSIIIPSKVGIPINWLSVVKDSMQIISGALNTLFILTKI